MNVFQQCDNTFACPLKVIQVDDIAGGMDLS